MTRKRIPYTRYIKNIENITPVLVRLVHSTVVSISSK